MRMEFVKGTSISFTDRFSECESETKALGMFLDRKSNQSAENELDGIIVNQRQWRTHPFDMNVKQMPGSKMTQWTTTINEHMHKTPSLFLVFHFYEA